MKKQLKKTKKIILKIKNKLRLTNIFNKTKRD